MGKKSTKRALEADAAAPSSEAPAPAAEAMEVDVAATDAAPKAKKSKKDDGAEKEIPAEALAAIASPLAVKKTNKHLLKLVKKGECGCSSYIGAGASGWERGVRLRESCVLGPCDAQVARGKSMNRRR